MAEVGDVTLFNAMRIALAALALLLPATGLVGCMGARQGVRASQAGPAAAPTVAWAGQVQAYTDGTFETPTERSPLPIRVEVFADGRSRDGAAGMLRFGGDANCAYRLARAGVVTEGTATVINFDAAYAGSLDLASTAGGATAILFCGQSAVRGRLITTLVDGGLLAAFVGEQAGGQLAHYRGLLPAAE